MAVLTPTKKRKTPGLFMGLASLLALYSGISFIIAQKIRNVPRLPLDKAINPAIRGLKYEEARFLSFEDKLALNGWFIPGTRSEAVIIVNGGFQNRVDKEADTLGLAHDLVQYGYNLLMFDLRGRGESADGKFGLRNMETDIRGAVDYVKSRGFATDSIYILGFSAGAAATCLYGSRHNLGGIILDGCFARVAEALKKQARLNGVPGLVTDIFIPGALTVVRALYHDPLINPVDAVANITCPIFFIHEEKDVLITHEEVQELFRLSRNPQNEIWHIRDALHSQSYKSRPVEYVSRVTGFLTKIRSPV